MKHVLVQLVRLLPRDFRLRFGEEMRGQIDEDYDRAMARGRIAALACALTTAADLLRSAAAERLRPTWNGNHARSTEGGGVGMMVSEWMRDLDHAARALRRAPGFTAVTVVTLGLAIGANAGIFAVVDTVLLDPLPFEDADRLVAIRGSAPGSELPETFNLPEEFYLAFRESRLLESVSTYNLFTSSLRVGEVTERPSMSAPDPSVFETLGVTPILGRLPNRDDDNTVVMLSHALWTSRLGADPDVIGRSVFAFGDRTVIGVMPADFWLPVERVAVWAPLVYGPENVTPDAIAGGNTIVGRLAPGATHEALERELTALARQLPERFGGSAAYARQIEQFRPVVRSLEDQLLGDVSGPLWILFAAVGVVLLIACVNVANLFTVRAEDRLREAALRRALGAGRRRLASSLLAEAAVIAALSGIAAVVFAWVALPLILSAAPPNVPRLGDVGLGGSSLAFAALASAFCALACGLAPAFRSSAPDLKRLREGGRGYSRRRHRGRDTLVAAQTALALVLLIGSGLLIRSFWELSRVDPGYDTEDIYTFQIAPQAEDLVDGPSYARFHLDFMERLRALPGVTSVGILENVPLNEGVSSGRFRREEEIGGEEPGRTLSYTFAAGDVFETMGIDLIAGRALGPDDVVLGLGNVVVNQATVDLLWPGQSALGRRIQSESTGWTYTVVGVVENVLQHDFRLEPFPMVYLPLVGETATSWVISTPGYVVRTERADRIEPDVRELVRAVAPGAPLYRNFTMADLAADSMVELSFTTLMLGSVSTLALILGAIGLYGVLSYVVAQRTREIGVRMALGAPARLVRRMVVAQGARVVLVGIVLGLAIAVGATRTLESLLFGVEAGDAATFLTMAASMVLIGFLASYLPARRASNVDPVESLRAD